MTVTEEQQKDEDIELTVVVKVRVRKAAQTAQLPAEIEECVEKAGQEYKRELFKWLVERADGELAADKEESEKLTLYDKKPTTFKTIFGSVPVKRKRVIYEDGRTEIPSAHCWRTPRNVTVTRGLRTAVCDLAVKTSISNTQKGISQRTGERDMLCARTILNILHKEGASLIEAQEKRARKAYEAMPEGKCFQIDVSKPRRKRLAPLSEEQWESDYEGTIGTRVIWHWEAGKLEMNRSQRNEGEGLIIVQCDEVIVPAQSSAAKKDVWIFTGVVNAGGRAYYFTAESAAKLFCQIGALLGALRVHEGYRDILVLGDGARWIRRWYRELPVARKSMTLCWYHLTQTCHELLTAGFGYARGLALEAICLRHLRRGEVMGAVNAIEARETEVINRPQYRRLIRYLKARLPFIPNYKVRRGQGQWVANTRVEAFNNWSVASRCKGQGRTWGSAGVRAVAALAAAERNDELETWRQCGELPEWEISAGAPYQFAEAAAGADYQQSD